MIRNCVFAYNHGRYKNGDLIYSYFLKKEAFFVKKILLILLVTILASCSKQVNNDKEFLKEFGLEEVPVEIKQLSYEELSKSDNLDGIVLIVRNDCQYCHDMLNIFKEEISLNYGINDLNDIYLLDSGKMDIEEKESLTKNYFITSVPTIAIFQNGHLTVTEIGIIPNERMKQIIVNSID